MCAGITIFFGIDFVFLFFWMGDLIPANREKISGVVCLQLVFQYEIKLTFLVRGSRKLFSILQYKVNV